MASFRVGTAFRIDAEKVKECLWDCSGRYRRMIEAGDTFLITDCWIDEETGQPRFLFREKYKPPQDRAKDWEIGGTLAYIGIIQAEENE